MESYRDMIYRYSTGQGPSILEDLPENATDWVSFSMDPLRYRLSLPQVFTDLKREADRLSMQVEEAARIIKTFGSNPRAENKYLILKKRLELVKHLMLDLSIRYISNDELENLHIKFSNGENVDSIVDKLIKNKKASSTNKKYLEYDAFGQKLNKKESYKPFTFGETDNKTNLLLVIIVGLGLVYLARKKKLI